MIAIDYILLGIAVAFWLRLRRERKQADADTMREWVRHRYGRNE